MKKKILAILLTLTFLLSGCSVIEDKMDQINNYEPEHVIYERYRDDVLDCLESGDREGLEELFSENARESDNFEKDLDKLFEIWGDFSIPDRENLGIWSGPRNRAWDYGECSWDVLSFELGPFALGEIDYLCIHVCVDHADEDIIGLMQVCLIHDIYPGADDIVHTVGDLDY